MDDRCKTCGTPLDEVPFDVCAEHSAYWESHPYEELTDDEVFDIAYQDAMESAYRYGRG